MCDISEVFRSEPASNDTKTKSCVLTDCNYTNDEVNISSVHVSPIDMKPHFVIFCYRELNSCFKEKISHESVVSRSL